MGKVQENQSYLDLLACAFSNICVYIKSYENPKIPKLLSLNLLTANLYFEGGTTENILKTSQLLFCRYLYYRPCQNQF